QRYLFSAGTNAAAGNALLMYVENTNAANGDPNSLKLRFGNNTTTMLDASKLVPAAWYYVALTYSEARVPNKAIWYVGRAGGVLTTGMTTNSPEAVAGAGAGIVIGNNETLGSAFRSPGNGQIDEFAIWNRELSSTEIND